VKQELEDAKNEGATDIAERLHNKRDSVERKMSDCGFALGYVGGLVLLVVCIPVAYLSPSADSGFMARFPFRICILLAALWWLAFSIPTFLFVRKRGGPDFPESKCCGRHPAGVLFIGAESTASTLWNARQNKQTLLFLLCYFIYSDSYNTMASVGILFGSDVLCMDQIKLLVANLTIQSMDERLESMHLYYCVTAATPATFTSTIASISFCCRWCLLLPIPRPSLQVL